MSDRLVAVVLLAVCGVLYWQTFAIRRPPFAQFESFDAASFPRLVLALLAAFSLVMLLRGGGGSLIPRVRADAARRWLGRYRLPLLGLAAFVAYALVMSAVGWNAATIAYLVTMQLLILPRRGPRDLALVVGGSAAFTFLVAAGFERFLHVVLPRPDLF
jgi:hypothetical protein